MEVNMIKSNDKKVSEFIHDLQAHASDRYEIVRAIREIFLMQNSEFDESIKYGGIVDCCNIGWTPSGNAGIN